MTKRFLIAASVLLLLTFGIHMSTGLFQGIWKSIKSVSADAVMNSVMTLLAVFLGAMLAFAIQLHTQKRQEKTAALMSTHRILFFLLQQANTVALIQRDFIKPHLSNTMRFLSIPAIHEFNPSKELFDINTLSFLLESNESRGFLYSLYMAQESYVEALKAFNERSRIHRHEVQPLLAQAGLVSGREYSLEQIQEALGPFVFSSIVNTTDMAIVALRRALARIMESKIAFRGYAVKKFSGVSFTEFDIPDDSTPA